MEFKIEKNALLKLVNRAASAAASKSTMPILTYVLLSAEKRGDITCTGTDLVLSVSSRGVAEVKSSGAVALPARKFASVVKSLPSGDLVVALKDGMVTIKAGKSRFKSPTLPAEDFPCIPKPNPSAQRLSVGSGALSRLLAQTVYARCTDDEARQFIACVRFEHAGGSIKCVATDSKRLAVASAQCGRVDDWGADHINSRALSDVRKLCDEFSDENVVVSSHGGLDGYLYFEWQAVTLTAKSAGSDFVPYEKFIPRSHGKCASVSRQDLIDALKRASLASGSEAGVVKCELKSGTLAVSARSSEHGESSDELEADYTGEEFAFGVSAPYLIEALNSIVDDTVLLQANGPRDPLVIVGETSGQECMALVMFTDL